MAGRLSLGIVGILGCACSRAAADAPPVAPTAGGTSDASPLAPSIATAASGREGVQRTIPLEPGMFLLSDLGPREDGAARYLASAYASRRACRFELQIAVGKPSSGAPFAMAHALLLRRPTADCTEFLRVVAGRLGFVGELPKPRASEQLSASLAILGTNQSRVSAGEIGGIFSSVPSGHWTAMKLFLADGEGEVFLNIDVQDGVGEFSIKDEDYAAVVVTDLAKILLPDAG